MSPPDDLRAAADLIAAHFDYEVSLPPPRERDEDPAAVLARLLATEILRRLRGDLGSLMQALYRIDVPEPAVNRAFAAPTLEDVATALADLILERELQTVALRRTLEGGEPGAHDDDSEVG
jgi:hypothetical protein